MLGAFFTLCVYMRCRWEAFSAHQVMEASAFFRSSRPTTTSTSWEKNSSSFSMRGNARTYFSSVVTVMSPMPLILAILVFLTESKGTVPGTSALDARANALSRSSWEVIIVGILLFQSVMSWP